MSKTDTELRNETESKAEADLKASDKFLLEESVSEQTGLWYATVIWAPRGSPSDYSLKLRERKSGAIQIDYGARGEGGRKSTGTEDPQEAIWFAEAKLRRIVMDETREDLEGNDIYKRMAESGGDPYLVDCFNAYLKRKVPGTEGGVTPKWYNFLERVRDTCVQLFGRDFRALDCNEDLFVQPYIEARANHGVDFGGARQNLKPTSRKTAGRDLRAVFTVLEDAHGRDRPGSRGEKMLRSSPLKMDKLPEKHQGRGKEALTLKHLSALIDPRRQDDGTWLAPPIDRVDNDPPGRARLITYALFHHSKRVGNYVVARDTDPRRIGPRRRDIARTPEEVRELFERLRTMGAIGITVDSYKDYPHGVWFYPWYNDKNGLRNDQPNEEWNRIYPLTAKFAHELDIYHRRTEEYYGKIEDGGLGGLYDWHPDDPVFRDTLDPSEPLRKSPMFRSVQYEYAEGGEETYNRRGTKVVARKGDDIRDENGEKVVRSQGGWFRQAQDIARADAIARGENPDDVMPIYSGELGHGTKAGWVRRVEKEGWLTVVEGQDSTRPLDLNRHALYLESRKMPPDPRARNYMDIEPIILNGIANYLHRDDVLAEREKAKALEDQAMVDESARLAELYYGERPALKVVNGNG